MKFENGDNVKKKYFRGTGKYLQELSLSTEEIDTNTHRNSNNCKIKNSIILLILKT